MKTLEPSQITEFHEIILNHYKEHGRAMLWREDTNPYIVFISELMLQQTQVSRVEKKIPHFIQTFPDFAALASASLTEILAGWQGLGYNRRARYLQQSAVIIVDRYGGELPRTTEELRELPGIGPNTAASILVFAFNQPLSFIETNIRRVFLHHFFPGEDAVHDRCLLPLIELCLDSSNPRRWYYALMDYGAALGEKIKTNPNRRSVHYTRQSPFAGSIRQMRGQILRVLVAEPGISYGELRQKVNTSASPQAPAEERADELTEEKFIHALEQLEKEGFLREVASKEEGLWLR